MAISLGELATRFGCDLNGNPDEVVDHVASLGAAGPRSLTFLSNPRLKAELAATRAGAVVLRADDAEGAPVATLIADDPYATYARMASLLHPAPPPVAGVHPSAVVSDSARVAESTEVGANAVIGENVAIGEHVVVGPGCVIGPDCEVGDASRLLANVTLARQVRIGRRCIVHPGAVIGADGFGNAMTAEGWVKVPQLGGVSIGDDVEIGANTTIDCGALDDTVIEDGVRIDNLCMIAHNVRIGAHSAMAAATAIAGSARIGQRCMFGGQAGVTGHISICDDVVVNGQAMVSKSIDEPGVYASSFPIEPVRDWNRRVARFRRIESLFERVARLGRENE